MALMSACGQELASKRPAFQLPTFFRVLLEGLNGLRALPTSPLIQDEAFACRWSRIGHDQVLSPITGQDAFKVFFGPPCRRHWLGLQTGSAEISHFP